MGYDKKNFSQFAVNLKDKYNVINTIEGILEKAKINLLVCDEENLIKLIRFCIKDSFNKINLEKNLKKDEYILRLIEDFQRKKYEIE
jgi:hypothetical protein